MQHNIARAELIDRLLTDLTSERAEAGDNHEALMTAFAQAVLRRVDEQYLYRHRLTTLAAQLQDSFRWMTSGIVSREVEVRAFQPTEAEHGYALEGRVIETVMPDQPFIFDTLKLYLRQRDVQVHNSLNIIFPVVLDGAKLVAITPQAEQSRNWSYTRWYVSVPAGLRFETIEAEIRQRLKVSQAMVRDFHRMTRVIKDFANEFDFLAKEDTGHRDDCLEVRDFLEWVTSENFILMGISCYVVDAKGHLRIAPERGLGAMRDEAMPSGRGTDDAMRFLARDERLSWPIARVRKSTEESLVHRAGKVDEILVRTFDDQGRWSGGFVIHGMFTFKGLGQPGSDIPILRRKVNRIIRESATVLGSYQHKSLVNAFNALPVEYLFEADDETIKDLLQLSVKADATREIQSQVVINEDASSAYVFVVLPKEHYSDELRVDLQDMLQGELKATYVDHRMHLGKFGTVALHFYLTGEREFGRANLETVEERLVELGTPWTMRLRQRLEEDMGHLVGADLYARYADAFPEAYTEITSAAEAVVDIGHLEQVVATGRMRFDILPSRASESEALLRIYSAQEMRLTDILPVVDNFGVVVVEQYATEVTSKSGQPLSVNTLRVERGETDVLSQRVALVDALMAVFERRMRSDRLNRLLLKAHLTWKEVDLFRALYTYSRQLGSQIGAEILQKVLMTHSTYVSRLAALFRARFDPDLEVSDAHRADEVARLGRELRDYLTHVKGFEEDRVLSIILNLIEATLRTNFYVAERSDGEHFISLKIESARVREMPEPRPMYEIYVHHARIEGVHLRGGRVARGGIRWSDRIDDYRSEVLGLMATQMLKNTLIVPVGAKGGFVLKDPIEDFREARARADALYRIFIRGLLEITDNIRDGQVVPPPRVRRYDGDDPYLVVAADKGTAHLSDTANELSRAFDFWLGDAFASGGSVGYDHKEKGITARGAWVCVRRHFAEMDLDPEIDEVSVVGIGDMSGDVFGNGMLLSKSMKLIGAFNHRHIFLDPTPAPGPAWQERKRLFETKGSQWTDYDASLISAGGGVFDRGAKAIELSPEVRERLGASEDVVSGERLIRLILTADVDLLWNGGIGTYVKATSESHAEVEDKDNDRVRVDASQLRCKVIGEGGNLGVTMRGRVEYALAGGRVNLDAIDNSGGVDLSDHEVNLKILLQPLVRSGALEKSARDKLLVEVGDEVCDMVLADSDSQSLAISLDEARSRKNVWNYWRAMDTLKEQLGFSRRAQRLPDAAEMIEHRLARKQGFLRPELAKLLAYSKMVVYAGLTAEPIGTLDELMPDLVAYFPPAVMEPFAAVAGEHMLAREIAATVQTNRLVDMGGVAYFPLMMKATQRSVSEIAAATLLIEDVLGVRPLREALRALGAAATASAVYQAIISVQQVVADAVQSLLDRAVTPVTLATRPRLQPAGEVAKALMANIEDVLPAEGRQVLDREAARLREAGVPELLAHRVAALRPASHALAVGELAATTGRDPLELARLFFAAGYGGRIIPFVERITQQVYRDGWDHLAIQRIRGALFSSLLDLVGLLAARPSQGGRDAEGEALAVDGLGDVARQISGLLQERIPVSATFVLSEQLRQRVRAMELELAARASVGERPAAALAKAR